MAYDDNNPPRRQRTKKGRDITLMTLLAFEADKQAQALLKKKGRPGARDHNDLEQKLCRLYEETNDKMALEKELAQIHPHKDWLLRTLPPPPPVQEPQGGAAETRAIDVRKETTSSFEGIDKEKHSCCACSSCSGEKSSGFNGGDVKNFLTKQDDGTKLIALIAVIGITFYFLKHN